MSSHPSPSPKPEDTGLGCRTLAVSAGILLAFGTAATVAGLALALGDGGRITQQIGFALYGAGAPVSGIFAAVAGELPLAPFTDIVIWLVLAVLATKVTEQRLFPLSRVLGLVIGAALSLGVVVSFLIERA
ncbi:MAG TPA: hypothetical protein VMS74_06205 [Acidimicrobiia bacterium]|nr:hypothetical protein [Acidimicrobiia bacterium]